jgi:rod shape determining protein RodA
MKNKRTKYSYYINIFLGKLKDISSVLFLLVILLALIGVSFLYSAADASFTPWAAKQSETLAIGVLIMLVIPLIDLKFIYKCSYLSYIAGILLLIIAEVIGHKAMGAQRWIRIIGFNFQPSEFMKIFLILALARYFYDMHSKDTTKITKLVLPIFFILFPAALILRQPNLGTALIILLIGGAIFFAAGVRYWKFVTIILLGIVSLPLVWSFMHDYQRKRVITFLNPESDPLGAGYNIIQSIIGIGSGGFFGKGFSEGSQSQLNFLPEKQTDFIFSVIAEELGFLGVIGIFVICIAIVFRCYLIALSLNNQFGRLIILGISTAFSLHIIVNTAMISGLIPASGVPFPMLSYGGSNLIVFFIGFGLVQNCKIHRLKIHR